MYFPKLCLLTRFKFGLNLLVFALLLSFVVLLVELTRFLVFVPRIRLLSKLALQSLVIQKVYAFIMMLLLFVKVHLLFNLFLIFLLPLSFKFLFLQISWYFL